jgi:hypothetical protein
MTVLKKKSTLKFKLYPRYVTAIAQRTRPQTPKY